MPAKMGRFMPWEALSAGIQPVYPIGCGTTVAGFRLRRSGCRGITFRSRAST